MKIGDVLSLYASGYTREEIAEIKQIYQGDASVLDAAKEVKDFKELKSLIDLAAEQEPTPPADPAPSPGAESEPQPEQSNELETLKQEKASLEQELKKAQDANASKNISGDSKDPEDTVIDIFKYSI